MKKSQAGFSAIEAVLILVVVCLIGFVGWFVWNGQKSVNSTLDNTNKAAIDSTPKSKTQAKVKDVSTVAHASVDVTVTHPETWTVSRTGNYETQIMGPGGDIYVSIKGLGGLGGMCDPSDPNVGTFKTVDQVSLSAPKLTLVTYTTQSSGGTSVTSAVVPNDRATKIKVGASACDGYLAQILDSQFFGKETPIENTVVAIQSKKDDAVQAAGKQQPAADVQAFLASSDYKEAVNIVKTLKY